MEEAIVETLVENRRFDPRRLEKLTLSRRALSLELESSRSSLWNVNDDHEGISLAPRRSPPRPSLENLRKIKKMPPSEGDDVGLARRDDDGISVLTPGNSVPSVQSMMTEEGPFSPISSSSPMRQPIFVKADRSALDAIAALGRRLHREEHPKPISLLLEAESPLLVTRRKQDVCSPTITRLASMLSPKACPVVEKSSSPPTIDSSSRDSSSSCSPHHSVAASSQCSSAQDAPSTAPTVTFLSRLLFGTPTKQNEHNNPMTTPTTTPEPSTPTGMYSTNCSGSSVEQHQYLLQLGQILGHSSSPPSVEYPRLSMGEVVSITSSISCLGEPSERSRGFTAWLRRSVVLALVILLLYHVDLAQVPKYGAIIMNRIRNQGISWIKIDSGSLERLEGAWYIKKATVRRHWNMSFRPYLERKEAALYSYWKITLYPLLLERSREIPALWRGLSDKGNSGHVVRRARQRSASSRVQWESGTVALSIAPDDESGAIDRKMLTRNLKAAADADRVQYSPTSASHETSILDKDFEWATRDNGDRAVSTYVVSLEVPSAKDVGGQAISIHVMSEEPLNFWQSSRSGAPFLSTDARYHRRRVASHSLDVEWFCLLASLRDESCLNIEQRDFCCEPDRTETTIRLPSLEETLKLVEEENDRPLIEQVSEFFRERQRRRLARTTGFHVR